MKRRFLIALACALTLAPSSAAADFHFVSIREVFPGESGALDAEYVELQAYAFGQNFVADHSVTLHDASGATVATESFDKDVDDGRNQMTFVMATAAAESHFGIVADEGMAPGLIDPEGGAVCWTTLDCVSWGGFSGALPSPAGSPATPAGIPDGMALRRTIAPGCPTLLEPGDDRNSGALDFSAVFPGPRPNSVAPSERACGTPSGTGSGQTHRPPRTRLRRRPPERSRDRTPTFRFGSNDANARFECKLDRRPFRPCRSPFTTRRLSLGRHTLRVRARNVAGKADPSPAFDAFRVVRRRR